MSYRVFFDLSSGLAASILVPAGTLAAFQEHVQRVERLLGLETTKYLDNPAHWRTTTPKKGVTDELFCKVASAHNRWVRWVYRLLGDWSQATMEKPPLGGWYENNFRQPSEESFRFMPNNYGKPPAPPETMTPADAQTFWHGLRQIEVPAERWTSDYYRDRMEHIYEVLRGREHEGVTFDSKGLSPKRAAAVINVFSEFLDSHDLRLDVPNGHDYLASSSDGGYDWCEKCGPAHPDDARVCRRKACPIQDEAEDRRFVLKDKSAGVYLGTTPGDWPEKLCKRALHFEARSDAEKQAKKFPKRTLTVIPVRVNQ